MDATRRDKVLAVYLDRLVDAFLLVPEGSDLEDMLDAELARVADRLGVEASRVVQARSGRGGVLTADVSEALEGSK